MTSKIEITNSAIIVNDYFIGDCPEIETRFRTFDPITHKYNTFGMYLDEETNRLYLPRGIDIWFIKKCFNTNMITKIPPNNYDNVDILMKVKPRDEVQYTAIKFMVGIGEYEANKTQPQLSVNLNTGKGKTYCSIATIATFHARSMIIAASVTLLQQWKNNILEYTNLSESDICYLEGSETLLYIAKGTSKLIGRGKIYLCPHGSLRAFGETYGWNMLNKIFVNLGIGVKIFDEAHTNFDNMITVDFFSNVAKTYYVTATPARSDFVENRIYQLALKNVPAIDLFDADKDPHTDYISIRWNSAPSPRQISNCKNAYGLNRVAYINYLVRQPNFYRIMRIVMEMVLQCQGKVLMYIGTNDALLVLYRWINDNYPEFADNIGIFTSLVPANKRAAEKEKRLLLSTTKSAGLGEHINGLKMTIVVDEPFKSSVIARQTLGRTRDNDTVYIDLVDLGFYQTRAYYYDKLPTFTKYAKSVSDTIIDQYELNRRAGAIEAKRANIMASYAAAAMQPPVCNNQPVPSDNSPKQEDSPKQEGLRCPLRYIRKTPDTQ